MLRKRDAEGLDGTIPVHVYTDALEAEFASADTISIPVFLLRLLALGSEALYSGSRVILNFQGLEYLNFSRST